MKILTVKTYLRERKLNKKIARLLAAYIQVSRDFGNMENLLILEYPSNEGYIYDYYYIGYYKELGGNKGTGGQGHKLFYSDIIRRTRTYKQYKDFIIDILPSKSIRDIIYSREGLKGGLKIRSVAKLYYSDGVKNKSDWDEDKPISFGSDGFNIDNEFFRNIEVETLLYERRAWGWFPTNKPYVNVKQKYYFKASYSNFYYYNVYMGLWINRVKRTLDEVLKKGFKGKYLKIQNSIDDLRQLLYTDTVGIGQMIYDYESDKEKNKIDERDIISKELLKYATGLLIAGGLKWTLK